jgi:hypothetical protein
MCQHAEIAFTFSRSVRTAGQRTPQPTLVTGKRRLRLPTLTEHPTVTRTLRLIAKPLHHLSSIACLGPLAALATTVQRNHGRPDRKVLAAIPMVSLAVESRVSQDAVPVHGQGRLSHDPTQLWRIVGRAGGHRGPGDEVACDVDRDGELGPEPRGVAASGSREEVSRGVTALQARAVDGSRRRVADQAAVGCGRGGSEEEADNLPFFSSRWAA